MPRAKILDVPCGAGRLSIELASRGYQVTGVDINSILLGESKRKAEERGFQITLEQRDMRELPWHGGFDGAICFWSSLGYFDELGNQKSLKPSHTH